MNIFQIITLAIVEGATEFLPVSSTAHLIIVSRFLGLNQTDFLKAFEVIIQSSAILAVLVIYWKNLLKEKKLAVLIFLAFLPVSFAGFLLYPLIKGIFFESLELIVFWLVALGLLFLFFEWFLVGKKIHLKKNLKSLNKFQAIVVGTFQILALMPGVSRAGAVILAMMILGFKRKAAAQFSFLLALPTIFAAGFFDLIKNYQLIFTSSYNLMLLLLGAFLSFIFSLMAIKFFLNYLNKHSLIIFGFYRIILGFLIWFFLK